jgi:uncharacterized protein (TIGR02145 family)
MKKLSFFIAMLLLISSAMFAQIGINSNNSTPDASAGLDVNFNNKGFLPPRVALTAINSALPVAAPATGLLVYNTAIAGTPPNNVLTGYYFWNGTKWIPVAAPQGTNVGDMQYWNGTQWVSIPVGSNGQVLTLTNGVPAWGSPCGASITISHIAGAVAPVTKTTTYGTVSNIPGEPLKCWITSNLGSDHQATSVSDATEASAGWYWQFNRKQGYKHDGTTRTPNTTWISSISETSDWIAANDPCTSELGAGWRIPTYTEWNSVNTAGGWTNWNGPWNAALKLHAAGYLFTSDGSLGSRGSYGSYWSGSQADATNGWSLYFISGSSGMSNVSKVNGFSVRCVRDY